MNQTDVQRVIESHDLAEAAALLSKLHVELESLQGTTVTPDIFDLGTALEHLESILQAYTAYDKNTAQAADKDDTKTLHLNSPMFKLLSRCLVLIMEHTPTKIYDWVNRHLSQINLEGNSETLSTQAEVSIIIAIDMFKSFPTSLGSLISYTTSQVYKILKKNPTISANLTYLLATITEIANKADIDDKLHQKLTKIATKQIYSAISSQLQVNTPSETSILLKKNYIIVLKNLLILSVESNYEALLALSASSASGARLKPDALMAQQHTFQLNILNQNLKLIQYGLSNFVQEIRIATIELLAHLLLNFIPTGKFNAIEYLVNLYKLPDNNEWHIVNGSLKDDIEDEKKPPNTIESHDSVSIVYNSVNMNLYQISIIETLVFFIQLEQVQNLDFLSNNLTSILELIIGKFGELNGINEHVQNSSWIKTLSQWETLIKFIINECGSTGHEILMNYIYSKFEQKNSQEPEMTKAKKRQSGIFSFKKKSADKDFKSKNINPYINPYQCYLLLNILNFLLPLGINFLSTSKVQDKNNEDENGQEKQEQECELNFESTEKPFTRELLFKLLISNNPYIRNYALNSFLIYSSCNKAELNQLILKVFKQVNQEFKAEGSVRVSAYENISSDRTVRLLSYSLALASLLKRTQYTDLQTSTVVKILSFCTQHMKQSSTNPLQHQTCWIILSSFVTMYDVSDFVRLNSSQFLIFWKSLLTSQLVGDENDAISNLKVRNAALVCLLNFLSSTELPLETLKQCQLLLAKSYNYLTYLENSYEQIGKITSFQKESQEEYNINVFGNPYNSPEQLSSANTLINSILYGKKILFLSYLRIAPLLKNDVSSSLVIFLSKVFSDSKIFSRSPGESKEKKKKPVTINDYDERSYLLSEDFNYFFGVTSKLRFDGSVDRLSSKTSPFSGSNYEEPFGNEGNAWFDIFEQQIFENTSFSINYDSTYFILNDYSDFQKSPTSLVTSLVDISIELFGQVFPFLASKIQMSLLEQIRNSIFGLNVDPLRLKAVIVNVSVLIKILTEQKKLDKEVIEVLLDILQKADDTNRQIIELNANSIGVLAKSLPNDRIEILMSTLTSNIAGNTDPLQRGKSILQLGCIYENTEVGFFNTYEILKQLLNDPNPIVYYYSIKSICKLLTKNPDVHCLREILNIIYTNFLDFNFSYDIPNKILVNTKCQFSSAAEIACFLRLFVSSLGPNLREESKLVREQVKDLIIFLKEGINCNTTIDSNKVTESILLLFQELVIFDPKLVAENQIPWMVKNLQFVISKNLKVGLETTCPTSRPNDTLFPWNSSFKLYKLAYSCFAEIVKIKGATILDKESLGLLWISMNLKPCEELKELIRFWLSQQYDAHWFGTLSTLFKYSSKKLSAPFIENNYQQKLLPLAQRQKKRTATVFKDEESESIVKDESSEKNEPVSWEFKLFIFELLHDVLDFALKRQSLRDHLTSKIQDIVNISFLGSTSPISEVKLQGVRLLDKTLELFGDIPDPLYPAVSIMEQQQAQIISALMPCFSANSDSQIIVETIGISSRFVNLPKVKFYSKQRLLRTLIDLLEEISSNKFLQFSYLENMSEFNKKSIQLSILNCWAVLKINSRQEEPELVEIFEKYSKLLISLWILVLREYSSLKYSDSVISTRELDNYSNYWINFISILSLELADDNNTEIKAILGEDSGNFFFVLFSQCIEALIKNQNVREILITMQRLMKSYELVKFVFNDEIFNEVIDIFDRLVLIDENTETKTLVVEIVHQFFNSYVAESSAKMENLDKLFELIRITMLPLFHILPILRTDFDPSNHESQYLLKHVDSGPNLLLLKKCSGCIVDMIVKFPDVVKVDLHGCILFIFAKIYEFDNSLLISTILPYLKQVIVESAQFSIDLITPFSQLVQRSFEIDATNVNSIITTMILVTSGNVKLGQEKSDLLVKELIKLLDSQTAVAMQCIKSLISYDSESYISKNIISVLVKRLVQGEEDRNANIDVDILVYFCQNSSQEKLQLYSLIVPLLLFLHSNGEIDGKYVHEQVSGFVAADAQSFKTILNEILSAEQRKQIEDLVKGPSTNDSESEPQIQLKTFGA